MIPAYIGLGSNLQDPPRQIERALQALRGLSDCRWRASSSLYRSAPLGPRARFGDQPDYINAVAHLDTCLSAHGLLAELQQIERRQGRTRSGKRWEARSLDLDLLLYGEQLISGETLTIPHPELARRAFTLIPLYELEPALQIPRLGALTELLPAVAAQPIQRLEPLP